MSNVLRILQITDSHLLADYQQEFIGVKSAMAFQAVINEVTSDISQGSPDLIILTGDLSQDDSESSYKFIINAVQELPRPIAWMPGNHDNPSNAKEVLAQANIMLQKEFIFDRWQVLLLSSYWKDHVAGELAQEELLFLEQKLRSEITPYSIIFLHHHVLPVGSSWLDNSKLSNSDDFLAIINKYSHAKVVVVGHVHQENELKHGSITFITTPSTSIQFKKQSEKICLRYFNAWV